MAASQLFNTATDPKRYVGCKIEIISNSDIRYTGQLYVLDPHAGTISLRDVNSFGTETRRPPEHKVNASEVTYEYIVFRVSDIKDLVICEPPSQEKQRLLTAVDPAIVTASDENSGAPGSNFPRVKFAPEFMQALSAANMAQGNRNNRGRNGARSGNNNGNNNNANNNAGNTSFQSNGSGRNRGNGNRGAGRGRGNGNRGRGGGRGGFGGGAGQGQGRRGGPGGSVFPYPTPGGTQDWLTRYQKDMNLKAEFQNVNPDLAALAKVMSFGSQELPPEKIRDIMAGNLEAFMTDTKIPGKEENALTKVEYVDEFFDHLTSPTMEQNQPMYNRWKDVETFGPMNGQGGRGGNGQGGRRNGGGQGGMGQQNGGGNNNAGWNGGQNGQGGQQRNRANSAGNRGNNGGGRGGNWGGNQGRGRGGRWNGGGRRPFGSSMNQNITNGNGGYNFTRRDLVIPGQLGQGQNMYGTKMQNTDSSASRRTQTVLWAPGCALDMPTVQQTRGENNGAASPVNWTFACSASPVDGGYEMVNGIHGDQEER